MKIEIDIRDDIKPTIVLEAVKQVVAGGKISVGERGKKYYSWATFFKINGGGELIVSTRQYRKNDCFVVYKNKRKD